MHRVAGVGLRTRHRRAYARRMRPSSNPTPLMSVADYLRREREARDIGSKVGYEYVAGEVYAMSPNNARHSIVIQNILHHLRAPTRAAGCTLLGDVMTRVAEDRFYYPDVAISCQNVDPDGIIEHPCFVVEVTSPSTRTTDLREKPLAYRANADIQGFLIVEQKRRHVIQYARRADRNWDRLEFNGTGTVAIPCVNAELTLEQIYETLDFPMRVKEDEFTVEEYGREWILVRAEALS
jgi:Uma2 family endonuclease